MIDETQGQEFVLDDLGAVMSPPCRYGFAVVQVDRSTSIAQAEFNLARWEDRINLMRDWCLDQFGQDHVDRWWHAYECFRFANQADACAFKLRWA